MVDRWNDVATEDPSEEMFLDANVQIRDIYSNAHCYKLSVNPTEIPELGVYANFVTVSFVASILEHHIQVLPCSQWNKVIKKAPYELESALASKKKQGAIIRQEWIWIYALEICFSRFQNIEKITKFFRCNLTCRTRENLEEDRTDYFFRGRYLRSLYRLFSIAQQFVDQRLDQSDYRSVRAALAQFESGIESINSARAALPCDLIYVMQLTFDWLIRREEAASRCPRALLVFLVGNMPSCLQLSPSYYRNYWKNEYQSMCDKEMKPTGEGSLRAMLSLRAGVEPSCYDDSKHQNLSKMHLFVGTDDDMDDNTSFACNINNEKKEICDMLGNLKTLALRKRFDKLVNVWKLCRNAWFDEKLKLCSPSVNAKSKNNRKKK